MTLDARTELQRIAKNWITVAALNAGAYLITSDFTTASDQKTDNQTVVPWTAPINTSYIVKRRVYDTMITGRMRGQGLIEAVWNLSLLTFAMETVFYGLYDDPDESQKVTIKTYDQRNVVRYLQCYAAPFNTWFDGATPIQGGYTGISIPFMGGTEIS
jgi:hypothetical protein